MKERNINKQDKNINEKEEINISKEKEMKGINKRLI